VQKISSLALLLFALSEPALAQSGVFVSGNVFADHKRFSGNSTESTLNVTSAGGGAGVGYQISDRWDVRGEVDMGGTTTITEALIPDVTAFQSRTRNQMAAVTALAGFSLGTTSRVRLTVLGGISFLHVKTEFDSVPSGLVIIPHTDIDNVVSPTVGLEVPLMLGQHFSVVPALRVNAFTLQTNGMNGFALRPGVAVRIR
jgi:Outer membrane protein beta-barrel domain